MHCRATVLALGLIVCNGYASAADTSKPDAMSVMNAMYAAVGVGNVDAAASFFAEDGYNIGPGGKKVAGRQALRDLIANVWVPEDVQVSPAYGAKIRDNETVLRFEIGTKWGNALGSSPSAIVNIVTLEGNKIKTVNAYYTSSAIEKMMRACDAKPNAKMPNGTTPCRQGISYLKKYTDSLIEQGIAEEE